MIVRWMDIFYRFNTKLIILEHLPSRIYDYQLPSPASVDPVFQIFFFILITHFNSLYCTTISIPCRIQIPSGVSDYNIERCFRLQFQSFIIIVIIIRVYSISGISKNLRVIIVHQPKLFESFICYTYAYPKFPRKKNEFLKLSKSFG